MIPEDFSYKTSILDFIAQNNVPITSDVATIVKGGSRHSRTTSARTMLLRLVDMGLVRRLDKKPARWKLTKKGKGMLTGS